MALLIQSFGFKHGLPNDANFVFDVRCLPNPYWQSNLKTFSGLDIEVVNYFEKQALAKKMINDLSAFLITWLPYFKSNHKINFKVSIGCTGGRHRSVYIVEQLLNRIKLIECTVQIHHRDLL